MRATITMPLETLKVIIERAREYEFVEEDDDADDELDDEDEEIEVELEDDEESEELLADEADDEDGALSDDEESDDDEEELTDVLDGLTSEELAELLALSWVGEGDYANWEDAVGAARALSPDEIILQLAENPTLSDAIERGLGALGYEISED